MTETVAGMRHELIDMLIAKHIPEKVYPEQWDVEGLQEDIQANFNLDVPVDEWAKEEGIADEEVRERLNRAADEAAAARTARFTPDIMRQVEKAVLLQTLDHLWREHLVMLDHLRQVVGFRGYAQRDPLNEYKTESFELFQTMLARLREAVTNQIMRVEVVQRPPPLAPEGDIQRLEATHVDPMTGENEMAAGQAALAAAAKAASRQVQVRRCRDRSAEPGHLGQGAAERPLPVRLRQEVQALPRPPGLRRSVRERSGRKQILEGSCRRRRRRDLPRRATGISSSRTCRPSESPGSSPASIAPVAVGLTSAAATPAGFDRRRF